MVSPTFGVDMGTGEIHTTVPPKYIPPPVRSPEWSAEIQRAAGECSVLLWTLAQAGHFKDAEELEIVAKAYKHAASLRKLADEKLSQIGLQT